MHNPYSAIIDLLESHKIPFEIIEHEPVFTSDQAATVRGITADAGAKSLLLNADGKFVLCILPGSARLDSKKVKKLLGAKNLRFAKPEEVLAVMGCEVGSCYPFGNLLGITTFVDPSLSKHEIISFSTGVHTKSIKMQWKDYEKITKPNLTTICVEENETDV